MATTIEPNTDSQLCGFLARLWIAEPDDALLSSLCEPATRELYQSLGGFVPDGDLTELVSSLGCEYCACFLGPKGHLPPHQSVVEQSHFQGECLSSLNQFIEVIGLPEGSLFVSYHSMPDHIGNLLGMLGRIYDAEAKASDLEQLNQLKLAFFQRHIAWITDYCKVASQRTNSDFYRGLFTVTQDFLTDQSK